MVSDAERYASEDKSRKDAIEARNEADTLLYSTERSLAEYRDKLTAPIVDAITAAMADLRTAMEGESAEDIRAKSTALQQAAMKIGEHLAGSGGGGGAEGGSGGGGAAAGGENVQDAEVKDK